MSSLRTRALLWTLAGAALRVSAQNAPATEPALRFELPRTDVLLDDTLPIVVSGVAPGASVTLRATSGGEPPWTSSATFVGDADGRVDVTRAAPTNGSYKGIDAMGLFWSAREKLESEDDDDQASPSDVWTLTAEAAGHGAAQATVRRRAVAESVRVTRVHEAGLVGTFYEPADGKRHPAFVVLSGSGGGVPPAIGPAGGLASHGYAVLALAYFRAEGLPRTLSSIPLEYFGGALRWLAARESVDSTRIGVLGSSRGAELALLLGVAYPALRAVVAYAPSNVVWRGCCDPSTAVAWTVEGRPLATMPPPRRADAAAEMRAEIQVERITGAVLLVSGEDDGVWPSAVMADKIEGRLRRHHFAYPHLSLKYEHAGHAISRPFTPTTNLDTRRHPLTGRIVPLGGTPAGTAKARADSWQQLLAFVDQNLRDLPAAAPRP